MHLPRPRLRLRTLLIAVAVAAVALGGWETLRRRGEYCSARAQALDVLRVAYRSRFRATYLYRFPASLRGIDLIDRCRSCLGFGCGVVSTSPAWASRSSLESLRKARRELVAVNESAVRNHSKAQECFQLAERYRHVARYPWLPMPREPE